MLPDIIKAGPITATTARRRAEIHAWGHPRRPPFSRASSVPSAAILVMVGLYGVVSYLVTPPPQRARYPHRARLDARPHYLSLVMSEAGRMLLLGTLIGAMISLPPPRRQLSALRAQVVGSGDDRLGCNLPGSRLRSRQLPPGISRRRAQSRGGSEARIAHLHLGGYKQPARDRKQILYDRDHEVLNIHVGHQASADMVSAKAPATPPRAPNTAPTARLFPSACREGRAAKSAAHDARPQPHR